MNIMIQQITLIILVFSLGFNLMCILPYCGEYYHKLKNKIIPKSYFTLESTDKDVIDSVVKASLLMDGKSFKDSYRKEGLVKDVYNYFFKKKRCSNIYNNFALAYLYAGLSYYAIKYNDMNIVRYLERISSKIVSNGTLNYKLTKVDQVPIGLMYINLYKLTQNEEYFKICQFIFDFLKSKRIEGSNIIPYIDNNNQYCDALGMFIPFLVEYSNLIKSKSLSSLQFDSTASNMTQENIEEYYKYGCDKETGIPVHGYNKKSRIKIGSANWGRGIGWYLLATSYLPSFKQDQLDSHLSYMSYSQFPLTSKDYDSSTALMFELYKKNRNLSDRKSIDFIKPYITKDGLIMSCSGDTFTFNRYSYEFGSAELTNGLFLILVSK